MSGPAMEDRKALKKHVVHSPEILLTFPYDPVGLAGEKWELRHGSCGGTICIGLSTMPCPLWTMMRRWRRGR